MNIIITGEDTKATDIMPVPKLPSSLGSSESSWGPPAKIPENLRFNDVPYAPFSKGDKLGKVADWTFDGQKDGKDQRRQQHGRGFKDPYYAYGASAASFFTSEDAENDISTFSVVDSTAKQQSSKPKAQNAVLKTRGGGAGAPGGGRGGFNQSGRGGAGNAQRGGGAGGGAPRQQFDRNPRFNRAGKGRFGWKDFDKPQKNRNASVKINEDWELIQTIGFNELMKLSFDVPSKGTDIESYGHVYRYNKALDKSGSNAKLQQLDRVIYNVSTSDDPVIQQLASSNQGTIFATDSVLALLMCATKTINPWDIVVNKKGNQIFLDKREGGPLDYVSVDENAVDPPPDATDKENINSASALSVEATYINHNFSANAVLESDSSSRYDFEKPNPFHSSSDSDGELLAQGYRYRKFNLAPTAEEEPINLVVRTKIDAVQPDASGNPSYVTLQSLNEYGGQNGVLEWKTKFDSHRGAIVAAEMKNNLSKLSRWTIQSILADAKAMKIGFVSRAAPKDNTQHVVVGVLGRDPQQFASQINLKMNNGWGIVKSIVNIANELEDGKYVLIKDPNNLQVKLYNVPDNAFEEE